MSHLFLEPLRSPDPAQIYVLGCTSLIISKYKAQKIFVFSHFISLKYVFSILFHVNRWL